MAESTFGHDVQQFVRELDDAAQCHMAWTLRVLRCAVLAADPGADVLAVDSHRCCRFDHWLQQHRERFEQLDAVTFRRLAGNHRQMHDAARGICLRILAGDIGDATWLDAFERAQAGVVADLALLKTAYLAHSARLDALTGLPLRYGLAEEFDRCHAQALRHKEVLVVLLLDLDHFKDINDLHGHAVGDLALRHFAELLKSHCRAGEPVFRFGGEEFLALLQTADHQTAQRAAERILQALRDHPLRLADGRALGLRASAGMAEVGEAEPVADAVARADQALYAAKSAGRDTWRWAAGGKRAAPALSV